MTLPFARPHECDQSGGARQPAQPRVQLLDGRQDQHPFRTRNPKGPQGAVYVAFALP